MGHLPSHSQQLAEQRLWWTALGIKGRATRPAFLIPADARYSRDEIRSVILCHIRPRSPAQHPRLGKRRYIFTSVIAYETRLLTGMVVYGSGHAIVATIGELNLDNSVLPTLCSILNPSKPAEPCSLASVASWADEFKADMLWSAPLHFANAIGDHPPQVCLFPGPKGWVGEKNINILGGIRNTTNLLTKWVDQGSDLSDPIASEALKFLIHFLGDLHMPFHSTGRAKGGNGLFVGWGGEKVRKCIPLLMKCADEAEHSG